MPFQNPPTHIQEKKADIKQESSGSDSPNIVTGDHSTVTINPKGPTGAADPTVTTGEIKSDGTVFSVTDKTPPGILIEIGGNSGVLANWTGDGPLFSTGTLEQSSLKVERMKGKIAVSTIIRDETGRLIAEIIRNEWQLRPSLLWDRNFNDNAIEVRDEKGFVVLQLVLLPDRIRIQGYWRSDQGSFGIMKSPRSEETRCGFCCAASCDRMRHHTNIHVPQRQTPWGTGEQIGKVNEQGAHPI